MAKPLKVVFLDFTGTIDVSDYKSSYFSGVKSKADKKSAKASAKVFDQEKYPRRAALQEKSKGPEHGTLINAWDSEQGCYIYKSWDADLQKYVPLKPTTPRRTFLVWNYTLGKNVESYWDSTLKKYIPVEGEVTENKTHSGLSGEPKFRTSEHEQPKYVYDDIKGMWVPREEASQSDFFDNVDDGSGAFEKRAKTAKRALVKTGTDQYYKKGNGNYFGNIYGAAKAYVGKVYDTYYHYGPNKDCVRFLKKLLDKTGAKIVYSSTRRSDGWKKCAEFVGLPLRYSLGHKTFGVTPEIPYKHTYLKGGWGSGEADPGYEGVADEPEDGHYVDEQGAGGYVYSGWKQREKEIKKWLDTFKRPLANYVILDDDPISSPDMAEHWIPSIKSNGFKAAEYKAALRILSR